MPEDEETMLPWGQVEADLTHARNYWIATATPQGKPHVTPIWGVWHNGCFYFDGSPESRRGRNIAVNPWVAVHLESGDEVVILEGKARVVDVPNLALTTPVAAAYTKKYRTWGYAPEPDQWDAGGLYEMRPTTAYAWTNFPRDATRWHFA